ncbi:hypothetical protein C8R46DRAFT_1031504 [Mycena filopes]|nr:hypothetical protein C8R46DRAFT_1031504 [Mycena filopes]
MAPAQSTLRQSSATSGSSRARTSTTVTSRAQAAPQPQANTNIDESDDDPDDNYIPATEDMQDVDDAYHPDYDDEGEDEVEEEPPSRGRPRRVSDKQAQLLEEQEEAKARKHEKALKAVKAAKKKAGIVEQDTRGPIQDDVFTSRTVTTTRPTATKNLAQRNSRVPAPAQFPSQDWYSNTASSGSDRRASTSQRTQDQVDSDTLPTHTSHGRSPAPQRLPAREPIRNINGGIVPDSVSLQLYRHHNTPDDDQPSRPPSPRPQQRARQSSPSRHRQPVPRRVSSESPASARSSSPSTGEKRTRSDDEDDLRSTQSQRTSSSGGRPRAKDLDEQTKEYTLIALDYYRCAISTEDPYPAAGVVENELVRRVWKVACDEMGEWLILTPAVAKLIASRGAQLRGELKTKAKPLVALVYGFKTGQNKKTIAFNRKLAEDLKENSAFAFKDVDAKTGLYKNPIFQMIINAMWFANRRDEGPRHPEFFRPFPVQGFALTLAVTENIIDEHLTGIRTDVPFTANDYRSVYEGHLKSLEQFAAHTQEYRVLDKILKRIHNEGRFHSGAQPIATVTAPTFSKQILDAAIKESQEGSTTDEDSEEEPLP